jgi:hypothetical protein
VSHADIDVLLGWIDGGLIIFAIVGAFFGVRRHERKRREEEK